MLSFMSKVSGYEFYHTLVRLTDNTGTKIPLVGYIRLSLNIAMLTFTSQNRFQAFMRMVREWCHLKLLKH